MATASTTIATRPAAPAPWQRMRPDTIVLIGTILLGLIGFIVLYPIILLAINSFNVAPFGRAEAWGLANWDAVFSQPRIVTALQNTLSLAVTRQGIALIIGVVLAWILARTNLPGRRWL